MSIIKKMLSGFIAIISAFMLYSVQDTPEARAWAIAMSGWVIIFFDELFK